MADKTIFNNINIYMLVAIIILSFVLIFYRFQGFGNNGYSGCGMMSGFYGSSFGWGFGGIFMALCLIAVVLFIIWLIKQLETKRR